MGQRRAQDGRPPPKDRDDRFTSRSGTVLPAIDAEPLRGTAPDSQTSPVWDRQPQHRQSSLPYAGITVDVTSKPIRL